MAQKAKTEQTKTAVAATAKPKRKRRPKTELPEDIKNPVGRPTKFENEKTLELVYKLALLGCNDEEIADILNIHFDTLYEWKKVYPQFSEALTRGREIADAEIANSMYERAKGWRHKLEKPMTINGELKMVEVEEAFPPDTKAATIWLTNRHGKKWRDKQEQEVKMTHSFEDQIKELMNEDGGSQPI